MKRGLILVILSVASMCLFNSPIRGDTHVSESYVGFTKAAPATLQPNVPDKPIYSKVETASQGKQQYLPQTDEQSEILLSVIGLSGMIVVLGYGIQRRRIFIAAK